MPETQYPTNPNTDTVFVVQEDGTKNRALMVAPQDTSTLELPSNANSTKGYVTINGRKQRVILTADIGSGGGGSVDTSKVVNADVLPTADASSAGKYYLYTGATTAEYTQNYIYKNVKTATYTGTVSFEAATLSSTTVACSGDNFANFLTESGVEPLSVVSGTMTYDSASALWVLVGKDSDGNTVLTFQEYQQDFVDAGFTFTGTPQDGDVVAFTCTVEEASATYTWTRVDVQPAGSTYTAGTGISIDANNEISVTAPTLTNTATQDSGLTIQGTATTLSAAINIGKNSLANAQRSVVLGSNSTVGGTRAVCIGFNASATKDNSIAIGGQTNATADGAIQIGNTTNPTTNSDANTFKVGNANGNYEIMSADGTIPADRLTHAINKYSTMPTASASNLGWIVQFTGTTDATYTHGYLYECKAQGTDPETYTWETVEVQASSGGLPDQTGNAGKFLTTDGTDASWSDKPLVNKAPDDRYSLVIARSGTVSSYPYYSLVISNELLSNDSYGTRSISIGYRQVVAGGVGSIAIGYNAKTSATNAIEIASGDSSYTNSDANTFKVGNANGNFELMNANGNLPADRLASTTGLADGNYRLRLVMASGVPTLEWVAE